MLLNQMIQIIFHGETKTYKETKKKKLFWGYPHKGEFLSVTLVW